MNNRLCDSVGFELAFCCGVGVDLTHGDMYPLHAIVIGDPNLIPDYSTQETGSPHN